MSRPTFDDVAQVLEKNLRDTVGDCICDEAYTERGLEDPLCGWHNAVGTTDLHSVRAVLALFEDESEPEAPGPLRWKFDGGRGAMLNENDRIVGYWTPPNLETR